MDFKVHTLVVMIFAVVLTATAAERATADDAGPSCCVCFCGSQNATMMGTGSSDSSSMKPM